MFRALAAKQQEQPRREGFMDQNQYVSQATPNFGSRLPNMVLTGLPTAGTTTPKQILQNRLSTNIQSCFGQRLQQFHPSLVCHS